MNSSYSRDLLTSVAASLLVVSAANAIVTTQTYQDGNSLNTWNSGDTNWDAGVVWTDDNDAVFGGTGEAITVGTVSAHNLTFDSAGYSLGGGTLTLTGTTPTTTANADATINSTVAGSAGLAKAGVGVLTLGGSNSYTGTTSIDGGVLSVTTLAANGGNSGIGAGTDVTLNGGTLRYTGGNNGSDAGAKFNRNISVGASGGTLDLAGTGFLFYGGSVSGSGALKVIDSSGDASNRQLLVSGNSAGFTGNLEIGNGSANSGWVQYRSNAASPFGSGTITVLTGGVLSADNGTTGPTLLTNPILLSGGTLMAQSSNTNFSNTVTAVTGTTSNFQTLANANLQVGGALLGDGTLQKNGGVYSVQLSGDNSGFAGTYRHTADGATILYTANSGSAAAVWDIPTGSVASARFIAGGANLTYKLGALSGATGRLETLAGSGNSIFEIGALNTDTTFAGAVQNAAADTTLGITKVGTGTLTLEGTTPYTGITTVSAGRLRFNFAGNSLGSVEVINHSEVYFYRGGNGGTVVSSKLSGSGTWIVDGPGGGPDQWSNRVILAGVASDHTAAIRVINGGKLWSQPTSTHNPIGDTANVDIESAALFNLYGPFAAKETIGALTGSGTVDFSDGGGGKALTLEVGGGDKSGSFSGTIQNTGTSSGPTVLSISKTGTGTQVLDGTNTYGGTTTVNGGTLELGFNGSLRFSPGANGIVNGISGTGAVVLNGVLEINLANADLTDGNSWLLVDVDSLTESYGGDFLVANFSEISPGVWELEDGANTWTFKEAFGTLELAVNDPYLAWTNAEFLGETNPDITGSDADPDGDGVTNGIEFLTGSTPDDSSSHNAPVITRNGSGDLVVTFQRADAAEAYEVAIEHSTTLQAPWTSIIVPNDAIAGPPVTVVDNGTAPDDITVVIAAGDDPRKFARVKIAIPAAP
ncbi:autotransporter-associated beta strand repeat-containing protein [Luteolibacter arcticus]|uniref:Autotransporter-associated beta strand repeat-containing protein n=1 Tax=Luteolibacter arcticus TaxID=1581411 RepID=A0ABT3GE36_9BACT|nr:autotransporter-associated beta strand repeat-containing protein [Luteolibacter arcticus]MCW1921886.1 autotransporter-associated beta strand repeat-containing protein [Luteolibacter arcticus]